MSSPPTGLAPALAVLSDDQGTGWLFLVLAALFVLTTLWRRLRGGPRRRGRSAPPPGGRRPGSRPPQGGEIWWADVPFEDGTGSKDRPCLVVTAGSGGPRRSARLQVHMITSRDKSGRPGFLPVERSGWGRGAGTSWVRVDRRVTLDDRAFRRFAGPCPSRTWAEVSSR